MCPFNEASPYAHTTIHVVAHAEAARTASERLRVARRGSAFPGCTPISEDNHQALPTAWDEKRVLLGANGI